MRFMIYARRSKDSTERQVSIRDQIERCRQYAERLGLTEVGEPLIHDGVSGGDGGRFFYLDHEIGERRVWAVIAYKLDRFGRDEVDLLTWLKRMRAWGVQIHTVDGPVDNDTASGKFHLSIDAAQAAYERNKIIERNRSTMARLEAMSRRRSRWLPYGYKLAAEVDLVEAPDEQDVIERFIIPLNAEGLTSWGIARAITIKGVRSRTGGDFEPKTVRNVLKALKRKGVIA